MLTYTNRASSPSLTDRGVSGNVNLGGTAKEVVTDWTPSGWSDASCTVSTVWLFTVVLVTIVLLSLTVVTVRSVTVVVCSVAEKN